VNVNIPSISYHCECDGGRDGTKDGHNDTLPRMGNDGFVGYMSW